ncbi:hypothetical protein Taro_040113 [Colocasia esculenta]|uniref:Uncharacterized protein n=1 Tax=Colocasia esculenta TaxID=4460 RepID=A0A843WTH9_COLES|nr:hypothetical protein [Colocasia esculenta]
MVSLRKMGYKVEIYKSRWKGGNGGLAAENYEYIDVVTGPMVGAAQQRYLMDVEFAGEFYIALPTTKYEQGRSH